MEMSLGIGNIFSTYLYKTEPKKLERERKKKIYHSYNRGKKKKPSRQKKNVLTSRFLRFKTFNKIRMDWYGFHWQVQDNLENMNQKYVILTF